MISNVQNASDHANFVQGIFAVDEAQAYAHSMKPKPQKKSKELEEGLTAYVRGDYETALLCFRPLAEEGNSEAQFNLGNMYDKGKGVPPRC